MGGVITVDGSSGEGGGQILRTALALSLATGIPFRIEGIRERRPRPGLKAQHLAALRAIEALTESRIEGASPGGRSLSFSPGPFRLRFAAVAVETAGALSLVIQSLLLPMALEAARGKELKLNLTGGTDVAWSPPVDWTRLVLFPALAGVLRAELRLLRRGYYPKGGGRIDLLVRPTGEGPPRPLDLLHGGPVVEVGGVSHASGDLARARVAERQAEAAERLFSEKSGKFSCTVDYGRTLSTGSGIVLWAALARQREGRSPAILGSSALGERRKRAERVGAEAARDLCEEIESGASADVHLADQLVPWVGFFGGGFRTRHLSGHLTTNVAVTERFLGPLLTVDSKSGTVTSPGFQGRG